MVEAAFEAINERDWDHLWGLHVDNIIMSVPDLPDPLKGREAVQGRLQAWAEALPDLSWKYACEVSDRETGCAWSS